MSSQGKAMETRDQIFESLKSLKLRMIDFMSHGDPLLKRKEAERTELDSRIVGLEKRLQKRNKLKEFEQLEEERATHVAEAKHLQLQISEYMGTLEDLLSQLDKLLESQPPCSEGGGSSHEPKSTATTASDASPDSGWSVLLPVKLWEIHRQLARERRRLEASLPIYASRRAILNAIMEHQVVVLTAETGSGKSTQIAQYLADHVRSGHLSGRIACTQPRKVAALALAQRVAEEYGGDVGDEIDCATNITGLKRTSSRVVYTSDKVLLSMFAHSPDLSEYGVILVDEAHERSLHTDLLLGMLKDRLQQRPTLRVVVMSATIDASTFLNFFDNSHPLHLAGRNHPIDIQYVDLDDLAIEGARISQGELSHWRPAVQQALRTHRDYPAGHVLVFLTSQREVEDACREATRFLSLQRARPAVVVPLHGKLLVDEQMRAFVDPPKGLRKIVFTTNVAETSITLRGVTYVVDSGMVKERIFDSRRGVTSLQVVPIDRASATQRAGRAGRTGPGTCFRMYSCTEFDAMTPMKVADICRQPLGMAVMQLLSLGSYDIQKFHFVQPPDPHALEQAMRELRQLGAIAPSGNRLTELGQKMARLGIEPPQAKLVLDSLPHRLGLEAIIIAAMMKFGWSIFARGTSLEVQSRADAQKAGFAHRGGDLLTLLKIYREWKDVAPTGRNKWCYDCSIKPKLMRAAHDLVEEIRQALRFELDIDVPLWFKSSCELEDCHAYTLRKLLAGALVSNLAIYSGNPRKGYIVVGNRQEAFLDSSSAVAIHGGSPSWVVYVDHISTSSRSYLQMVTPIDREWVLELESRMPWKVAALEENVLGRVMWGNLGTGLLERLVGHRSCRLPIYEEEMKTQGVRRCTIETDLVRRELTVYASMGQLRKVRLYMDGLIAHTRECMKRECIEESLCEDSSRRAIRILVGEGASVRHLLMPRQYVSVEISLIPAHVEERTMFEMLNKCGEGVAGDLRWRSSSRREHAGLAESETNGGLKSCTVTFRSPNSATRAVQELEGLPLAGSRLKASPVAIVGDPRSGRMMSGDQSLQLSLTWARRDPKDFAFVDCHDHAVMHDVIRRCDGSLLRGQILNLKCSRTQVNSIYISNINGRVREDELLRILKPRLEDGWTPRQCEINLHMMRFPAPPGEDKLLEEYKSRVTKIVTATMPRGRFEVGVNVPKTDKAYDHSGWVRFHEDVLQTEVDQVMNRLQNQQLVRSWQSLHVRQRFRCVVTCYKDIASVLSGPLDEALRHLTREEKGLHISRFMGEGDGPTRYTIVAENMRSFVKAKKAFDRIIAGTPVTGVDAEIMRLLFTHAGTRLVRAVETEWHVRIVCSGRSHSAVMYGDERLQQQALEQLLQGLKKLHAEGTESVPLRGPDLPGGLMKALVQMYGADLKVLADEAGATQVLLRQRAHSLDVTGSPESKQHVREALATLSTMCTVEASGGSPTSHEEELCPICLCEIDSSNREGVYCLENCGHACCRDCVALQLRSATQSKEGFPLQCMRARCGKPLLVADVAALLTPAERAQLWRASLAAFVVASGGAVRFCRTPNCDSVYNTWGGGASGGHIPQRPWGLATCFTCPGCSASVCTACHVEFHNGMSCEDYRRYGEDPDASLKDWQRGRANVKSCPGCRVVIEKDEGCDHVTCKCGAHVCWVCLAIFDRADDCYEHLRDSHGGINGLLFEFDYLQD